MKLYRCNYRYCSAVVPYIYTHTHCVYIYIYTLSRVVHGPFSKRWIIFIQLHDTTYFHWTVFHVFMSDLYVVNVCLETCLWFPAYVLGGLGRSHGRKVVTGIWFWEPSRKTRNHSAPMNILACWDQLFCWSWCALCFCYWVALIRCMGYFGLIWWTCIVSLCRSWQRMCAKIRHIRWCTHWCVSRIWKADERLLQQQGLLDSIVWNRFQYQEQRWNNYMLFHSCFDDSFGVSINTYYPNNLFLVDVLSIILNILPIQC